MENFDRKEHWEHVYATKQPKEVSWYESVPETSLSFIGQFTIPVTAKIIDIGGGDSFLVDHLLDNGYRNLTVLDISETAVERAKERLGRRAAEVEWIVTDISEFDPPEQYDVWHDRATFHFLTKENEISNYITIAHRSIRPHGILVMGTFSEQGPEKCSGISIKQYSEETITDRLKGYFEKINCKAVDHKTPFGTIQRFTFCSFRRLK